jgi:hypothetical protein
VPIQNFLRQPLLFQKRFGLGKFFPNLSVG